MDKAILQKYSENFKLIPLNENKKPELIGWRDEDYVSPDIQFLETKEAVGFVLTKNKLIIDVDTNKPEAIKSFEKLNKIASISKTIQTASGGFHCYYFLPDDVKVNYKLKEYPGIEFLSFGQQAVMLGSKAISKVTGKLTEYVYHPENDFYDLSFNQLPSALLSIITSPIVKTELNEDDFTDCSFISEEEIIDCLALIDSDIDYDTWLKIGMGIHSTGIERGYKLWDDWSKLAGEKAYYAAETASHWRSFKIKPDGIKFGTVRKIANEIKREQNKSEAETILEQIPTYNIKQLEEKMKLLSSMDIGTLLYHQLISAIKDRYKELGLKINLSTIKELTSSYKKLDIKFNLKVWLYLTSISKYFNTITYEKLDVGAFNTKFNSRIGDESKRASDVISFKNLMNTAYRTAYDPTLPPGLMVGQRDAIEYNLYSLDYIPPLVETISEDAQAAIERIKLQLSILCNFDDMNTNYLIEWIAHQVKYPGKLVRWCPIIQGKQGVGKSFVGNLLKIILGIDNVKDVKPDLLLKSFNGWAIGRAVNILEELSIPGESRQFATSIIKPLLTNATISIEQKGIDSYDAKNVTNYIAFTNHKNSIHIEEDDRRYFVVFCTMDNKEEGFLNYTGMSRHDWFSQIFSDIELYSSEIRTWLMNLDINLPSEAPATTYKDTMIMTQNDYIMGYSEAKILLETPTNEYNLEYILGVPFFDALTQSGVFISKPWHKNKLMEALGYSVVRGVVTIDNKRYVAYSSDNSLNNLAIQDKVKLKLNSDELL